MGLGKGPCICCRGCELRAVSLEGPHQGEWLPERGAGLGDTGCDRSSRAPGSSHA